MGSVVTAVLIVTALYGLVSIGAEGGGAIEYSGTNAFDAMVYASAAYCEPERVKDWRMKNDGCVAALRDFKVEEVYENDRGNQNGFAFIGVDSQREWVVAAFKGTNASLDDFIDDLKGGELMTKGCEANGTSFPGLSHGGFCDYYRSIAYLDLAADFVKLCDAHPTYAPVLIGHSLGAAAAVYAAFDATKRATGNFSASVFGFGQPRIGNHEFATNVENTVSRLFRVVHKNDIVAHLPVCCSVFGSACSTSTACPYHVSEELWYDNAMENVSDYKRCDGGEDNSCSNALSVSVDDHLHYFGVEVGDYCCFDE